MVFAIMRLFPLPKERGHLLEILRSVQNSTMVRPGCLGCWIQEEGSLQNPVLYGEHWASEMDLYDHIRSDLYRRVLAAMEFSRRAPEVQFHYVSGSRGLELIQAVRGQPGSTAALESQGHWK
jgi:quinol monooxygenase YgiN